MIYDETKVIKKTTEKVGKSMDGARTEKVDVDTTFMRYYIKSDGTTATKEITEKKSFIDDYEGGEGANYDTLDMSGDDDIQYK